MTTFGLTAQHRVRISHTNEG